MTPESGVEPSGQEGAVEARPPVQAVGGAPAPEAGQAPQQPSGRRAQLKVVRDSVESLSKDVGSLRKSHEASAQSLQGQVSKLRKELAAHARSMDPAKLSKSSQASTKRLEKKVGALQDDLAKLRAGIAKDAARDRAKQEAMLAKILRKLDPKAKSKLGRKGR